MAEQEIKIDPRALSDMRDVLEEMGYVTAQRAPDKNVIKKIDTLFGLENWLRRYGYL